MATLVSGLSQPFSALQALLQAEEQEDGRAKLSTVSWFADVWRLGPSTLPRVWKPVLVITLWATAVAVLDLLYDADLGLTNNVVPLLSVVVGLLLVFRNSTAYARWTEGRQLFSNMSNGVRNLARITWCSVGGALYDKGRLNSQGHRVPWQAKEYTKADKLEKIAALRMMVAMVVAAKHHVRAEFDTDQYEDLNALLPMSFLENFKKRGYGYGAIDPGFLRAKKHAAHQPSMSSLRSVTSAAGTVQSQAASPGLEAVTDPRAPLLAEQAYDQTVMVHKLHGKPSLPLPIVIAHRLQLYFAKCKAQGLLESVGPAGYNNFTQAISSLTNEFTGMERLLTLPLPLVYGVHLKQTVTLYLFILPLVLVETMTWKMIPFVTFIAWILIGIEGIASEIESPFGHDASDLPLDYICAELRNEIEQMIARMPETPESASLFDRPDI